MSQEDIAIPPKKLTPQELAELEAKYRGSSEQSRNEAFRRANDIRYKNLEDLQPWQKPPMV